MKSKEVIGYLVGVDDTHGVAHFSFLSDRFRQQERTWVASHRFAGWLTISMSAVSTAVWLYWMSAYLLVPSNLWLGIPLVVVQSYALLSLLMAATYRWFGRHHSDPEVVEPKRWPTIDVFICTYDEPNEVLLPTVIAATQLTGDHRVWLLDDGRRDAVRRLAQETGVGYIVRPDNQHAKAGNINHALGVTDGELILVLDADHVVISDMLTDLVGLFDDPRVGLVQTPHEFANTDSIQHYAADRHEQSLFFRVIMPSKDSMGAAFWCGSAAILRRAALEDVGGVATETIAEDYHTSLKMISRGWTTRYMNKTYVLGMAPGDLDSYLIQRDRWARGNLSVLRSKENPLLAKGLNWKQRIAFTESLFAYGSGPMRLLTLAILAGTLLSGRIPLSASVMVLAAIWLPSFLLSEAAFSIMAQGYSLNPEFLHFETLTMQVFTKAWKAAIFKKTDRTFKVTPKTSGDNGGLQAVLPLKWTIYMVAALTAGLLGQWIGVLPRLPGLALWLISALAIMEIRRLLRTLVLVTKRRQQRSAYRLPAAFACAGYEPGEAGGAYIVGQTIDVSQIGIGVAVSEYNGIKRGSKLVLGIDFEDRVARFYVEVRSVRAGFAGLAVLDCQSDDLIALIKGAYVTANLERLRGITVDRSMGGFFAALAA